VSNDTPPETPVPSPNEPTPPEEFKPIAFDTEPEPERAATLKEAGISSGVDAAVDAVAFMHEEAAKRTGYDGWLLTDGMKRNWGTLFRHIFKKYAKQDWGLIITGVLLMVQYATMGLGYMEYRGKNGGPTAPLRQDQQIAPTNAVPSGAVIDNRGPVP
jgi:hypothetical protein